MCSTDTLPYFWCLCGLVFRIFGVCVVWCAIQLQYAWPGAAVRLSSDLAHLSLSATVTVQSYTINRWLPCLSRRFACCFSMSSATRSHSSLPCGIVHAQFMFHAVHKQAAALPASSWEFLCGIICYSKAYLCNFLTHFVFRDFLLWVWEPSLTVTLPPWFLLPVVSCCPEILNGEFQK